ncbi:MAG: hypothetical protein HY319_05570 [Armatimonadetes bacterium]|nr:hypothetical protein [Armatimonadota bacterium]
MLKGLQTMSRAELDNVSSLAGIRGVGLSDQELRTRLLEWMADVVKSPGRSPEQVEAAVLLWLRDRLQLQTQGSEEELEETLFQRFLEAAARQMVPIWKVAACMAALAPPRARTDELELLDRVASRLLPADAVRSAMRREWDSLFTIPSRDPRVLIGLLQPEIRLLLEQPDMILPTLMLCLIISLADTKFEKTEEDLYLALAGALKVSDDQAGALKDRVGRIFWNARARIAPPTTERPEESRQNSLKAALITVEETALVAALEKDVRDAYIRGLHDVLRDDPDFKRGARGWDGTPLRWPLGLALGLFHFIRRKLPGEDQRKLAYAIHLAYARQKQTR